MQVHSQLGIRNIARSLPSAEPQGLLRGCVAVTAVPENKLRADGIRLDGMLGSVTASSRLRGMFHAVFTAATRKLSYQVLSLGNRSLRLVVSAKLVSASTMPCSAGGNVCRGMWARQVRISS